MKPARTRIAPSPTGDPHVGTAYQALFDLAYARKTGGQFVLRIEDTDQAREIEGSEQQIFDALDWLGLTPDEGPNVGGDHGPYRQSERLSIYRKYADQLLADGHAYYCWCSEERLTALREQQRRDKVSDTGYDRLCYGLTRDERAELPGFSDTPAVRMLVPEDPQLDFTDLIRGVISAPFPDDQVILKADGFPTYHLAVVVDDHLMGITITVRGEEWISSTPKHLLLYQWLGWELPEFAHMPLLRNPDKSKIAKRKNPAARLMWFIEQGYLPEALRNFLQLMAYPPVEDDQEISTFEHFVEHFDWAKVNTVGPVFDMAKLDWLNGHYIRELSDAELASRTIEHLHRVGRGNEVTERTAHVITAAAPLIKERIITLGEVMPRIAFLLIADDELVIEDDARSTLPANATEILAEAASVVEGLEEFTHDAIQQGLRERLVDQLGIKARDALGPVRVAISGSKVSPPLFESMQILGRESSLARINRLRESL